MADSTNAELAVEAERIASAIGCSGNYGDLGDYVAKLARILATAIITNEPVAHTDFVEGSLWCDEINNLVDAAFDTVSPSPSDHETNIAYRRAILAALKKAEKSA